MGKLKEYYFNEICQISEAIEAGLLGEEEFDLREEFNVQNGLRELDEEGLISNPTSEELEAMWDEYEAKMRRKA